MSPGNGVLTERASDPRYSRPSASGRDHSTAADSARPQELPSLSERPGQVRLHGVATGPQLKAVLQRSHATHRGDVTDRLHADGRQGVPAIWIYIPPTEVRMSVCHRNLSINQTVLL